MVMQVSGMSVTLVNPRSDEMGEPQIYMSVLYLATILDKHGYDVKIIDS